MLTLTLDTLRDLGLSGMASAFQEMPIASNYLGRACANSAPCLCPTQPSLDPPPPQRQSSIRPKGTLLRPASNRNCVRLRVGIPVRIHRNTQAC